MAPSEQSGYMKMLSGASGEPPPTLAKILEASKPLVRPLLALFDILAPIIAQGFEFGYAMYVKLPVDLFTALMGAGLCFCGGAYCASIAAVEAFRQCGWETTKAAILDVYAEFQRVKAAHDADEKKDADGDGVADVKRLTSSQLLQRKAALVAISIKDPEKLATALGGIWSAWLGVQGILRFEFAKTITLAISMADMVTPGVMRVGVPTLAHVVPPKYHHWVPTLLRSAVKALALSIAWKLQVVNSAAQSALRGGLMCTRALLRYACAHGYFSRKAEDTYLDEGAGYALAAIGFYCQLIWGFGMPFPLNLIMFPFTIIEWYIRWSITS
uniref:Uncharacterized protein n=1 Tax=Chrysotila carterae TaxID=13221 RepID=A0A6T0ADN1_CHRCT